MKNLRSLADQGLVEGTAGARSSESIWHVAAIVPAKRDAKRLFKGLSSESLAIAIDQTRNLALFPERQPVVDGQLLDLDFERVTGEMFYRLRIDDASFGEQSLRVFFYPQRDNKVRNQSKCIGTIWIVGVAWRKDAYKQHMSARCRRRVQEIVQQGS